MRTKQKSIAILLLVCMGCSTTKEISNTEEKNSSKINLQFGMSYGSIVENPRHSIEGGNEVDAFTGATTPGVYAGVHYSKPVKNNSIEAGIDFLTDKQTFTYNDSINSYFGERNISSSQIRIPITYNFILGKKRSTILNVGLSSGFNLHSIKDNGKSLPDYSLKNFTVGPVVGIQLMPYKFQNNSELGFQLEMFRSFTKVYDDYYQSWAVPGLSYLKLGIVYTLPMKK